MTSTSARLLPPPPTLGLPAHFSEWRPGQADAIMHLAEAEKPVTVLNLPTGVGKSLIYFAWQALSEARTLFLTATRGLQDQLGRDFEAFQIRDIRGAGNYVCLPLLDRSKLTREDIAARGRVPSYLGCDQGPCRGGMDCILRLGGCDYYDAVRRAQNGARITSNYSYAMHQRAYADGILGSFDAMVCDEAHAIDSEISRFLSTTILLSEVRRFLPMAAFPDSDDLEEWRVWATRVIGALLPEHTIGDDYDNVRALRALRRSLANLQAMPSDSLLERRETEVDAAVIVEPLWPGKLSDQALFGGTARLILSSATIRPKTLSLLGLDADDCDWYDAPSPFPVSRRPFTWIRTARISEKDRSRKWFRPWVDRIDEIVSTRLDTKGMIHSVSYPRAREIRAASRFGNHMLIHEARDTARTVAQFRAASPPCILVSPSMTTGVDFPGDQCRWQILSKVPFVPTVSPIMSARCAADRDYADYLAMVTVVQTYGRIMRSADDWGETFMIDDHWSWFRGKARKHAPSWFWQAARTAHAAPSPIHF